MTTESITVRVPHPLYSRLEERAKQAQRSMEEEVVGALAEAVSLDDDPLPSEVEDVLASLDTMPDDALWQLARTSRLYSRLEEHAKQAQHSVEEEVVGALAEA